MKKTLMLLTIFVVSFFSFKHITNATTYTWYCAKDCSGKYYGNVHYYGHAMSTKYGGWYVYCLDSAKSSPSSGSSYYYKTYYDENYGDGYTNGWYTKHGLYVGLAYILSHRSGLNDGEALLALRTFYALYGFGYSSDNYYYTAYNWARRDDAKDETGKYYYKTIFEKDPPSGYNDHYTNYYSSNGYSTSNKSRAVFIEALKVAAKYKTIHWVDNSKDENETSGKESNVEDEAENYGISLLTSESNTGDEYITYTKVYSVYVDSVTKLSNISLNKKDDSDTELKDYKLYYATSADAQEWTDITDSKEIDITKLGSVKSVVLKLIITMPKNNCNSEDFKIVYKSISNVTDEDPTGWVKMFNNYYGYNLQHYISSYHYSYSGGSEENKELTKEYYFEDKIECPETDTPSDTPSDTPKKTCSITNIEIKNNCLGYDTIECIANNYYLMLYSSLNEDNSIETKKFIYEIDVTNLIDTTHFSEYSVDYESYDDADYDTFIKLNENNVSSLKVMGSSDGINLYLNDKEKLKAYSISKDDYKVSIGKIKSCSEDSKKYCFDISVEVTGVNKTDGYTIKSLDTEVKFLPIKINIKNNTSKCSGFVYTEVDDGYTVGKITVDIDNINTISKCILENKDEAGNSYRLSSCNGGVSDDNPYCQVYCYEDYDTINFSNLKRVTSGRYFTLSAKIKGTKKCYVTHGNSTENPSETTKNEIDYTKFQNDIKKANNEIGDIYAEYKNNPTEELAKKLEALNNKIESIFNNYNECTDWASRINFNISPEIKYSYNESDYDKLGITNGEMKEVPEDTSNEKVVEYCSSGIDVNYNCNKRTGISYEDSKNLAIDYTTCNTDGCLVNTKYVSDYKNIRVSITKEVTYKTPNVVYNNFPSGEVTSKENASENSSLINGLPVSINTKRGAYEFKFNVSKLGEYYSDCSSSGGRLIGGSNNVADKIKKEDTSTFTGEYVCNYIVNAPDFKVCPNCNDTIDITDCSTNECSNDTKCPNCLVNLNLTYRTISTNNINPNGRSLGYNWDIKTTNGLYESIREKAEKTITEIQSTGDSIYNEEPILTVTLDSNLANVIRNYNSEQKSNGGYSNDTLECYDYVDDDYTYEKIFCFSTLLDKWSTTYSNKFKFIDIRPSKGSSNRTSEEISKASLDGTGYWQISMTKVNTTSLIGGASWK